MDVCNMRQLWYFARPKGFLFFSENRKRYDTRVGQITNETRNSCFAMGCGAHGSKRFSEAWLGSPWP